MKMMLPLVVLLHCYAVLYASAEGEQAASSEKEDNSQVKRSHNDLPRDDLCEASENINNECKVCVLLNHPQSENCCSDPDALLWCHLAIQEAVNEVETSKENDDSGEVSDEDEDSEESSVDNDLYKRYGSLFSNWQWYSRRNDRRFDNIAEAKRTMIKRYGNLFGSLFADRKINKDKRYGNVFGNLFGNYGDRDKRYGNLFGRLFSRHRSDKRDGSLRKRYGTLFRPLFGGKDKRYGSLLGPLFSERKRYGSLYGPLFSESKRYGSLMGRIYGRPKSGDDKRSMELDKRYGSLMGRPFSSKKLGR